MQLFLQLLSPFLLFPVFNAVFSLLRLIYALVIVYIFYLVLIYTLSCIIGACIVAAAYLCCVYRLGVSLLYITIILFQVQSIVIKPYVIYKAIYNYSFLDKEFLYFWYIYANNKGAIYLFIISLASLQRPLCPFIIFIICLVCIFLLKPLDLGNYKSWYKAFCLFYYLLYSCYIVRLASPFYPKAYGNRQDFNQVIFTKHFYANILSQPVPCPYGLFLYLL